MDKSLARVLSQLPQMFGSTEVLEKAKSLTDNPQALKAVARLEEIYELLKVYGYEKYVTFDFAMLSITIPESFSRLIPMVQEKR